MSPLGRLPSISLAEMTEQAGLMTRFDAKHVVNDEHLAGLAAALSGRARLLREGERESFRYQTVFYDDPGLRSYHDHAMGRIRRFKTRLRRYEDTGDVFVEVKMRFPRGQTVKVRKQMNDAPTDPTATPTEEMLAFLGATLDETLGVGLPERLSPSLVVGFDRSTIVAESSGERVTVDSHLVLADPRGARSVAVPRGVHVVEVKSPSQRSAVGRELHLGGSRPMAISKYCIGVALVGGTLTANAWRPAMRRLGLVGPRHSDAA